MAKPDQPSHGPPWQVPRETIIVKIHLVGLDTLIEAIIDHLHGVDPAKAAALTAKLKVATDDLNAAITDATTTPAP